MMSQRFATKMVTVGRLAQCELLTTKFDTKMKMNYSYNEMKRAFECGRNFQLTGENNFQELIEELNQALRQPLVSGSLPLVSRDELISSLEDKRLCNMSNLPADIYYLSRKETADYLMDNYVITKRQ
jgi:hypothetical protein